MIHTALRGWLHARNFAFTAVHYTTLHTPFPYTGCVYLCRAFTPFGHTHVAGLPFVYRTRTCYAHFGYVRGSVAVLVVVTRTTTVLAFTVPGYVTFCWILRLRLRFLPLPCSSAFVRFTRFAAVYGYTHSYRLRFTHRLLVAVRHTLHCVAWLHITPLVRTCALYLYVVTWVRYIPFTRSVRCRSAFFLSVAWVYYRGCGYLLPHTLPALVLVAYTYACYLYRAHIYTGYTDVLWLPVTVAFTTTLTVTLHHHSLLRVLTFRLDFTPLRIQFYAVGLRWFGLPATTLFTTPGYRSMVPHIFRWFAFTCTHRSTVYLRVAFGCRLRYLTLPVHVYYAATRTVTALHCLRVPVTTLRSFTYTPAAPPRTVYTHTRTLPLRYYHLCRLPHTRILRFWLP